MNIIDSFTARFNNSKGNPVNLDKKNKTSNLKTDVIMNNIIKIKGDNDFDFLNSKNNPKRENKREKRLYNRKNDNGSKKI